MSTHYHLSQSIPGALKNWKLHDWSKATRWITKDDGSRYTPLQLKDAFLDELEKGHTHLALDNCDNFDPKKGCLGHTFPDPTALNGASAVSPNKQDAGAADAALGAGIV